MTDTRIARILKLAIVATCFLAWSSRPVLADVVTFEWATVGNPGNAGDVQSLGTFGSVGNTYRISKHEVTNAQYTCFLNAVDPAGTNPNDVYNTNMGSDANGGINFSSGAANGSKYGIKSGRDNNPVVFVSYFDAMRFTNWLHNGQGTGSTESGVYNIGTGINETRAAGARFFIPSENESYKAAYYDPNTASYFDYPTSSNTIPTSEAPAGSGANSANYRENGTDNFVVTGSDTFDSNQNYLTDVGAYTTSLSPYGTLDQGGNVWEWNEAVIGSSRGLDGGSWLFGSLGLGASFRSRVGPPIEVNDVGFRVASQVPEPSTLLLGALGAIGLLLRRRR